MAECRNGGRDVYGVKLHDGRWWVTKNDRLMATGGEGNRFTPEHAREIADVLNADQQLRPVCPHRCRPEQANLGLATTAELMHELQVRAETGGYASYRTVDGG